MSKRKKRKKPPYQLGLEDGREAYRSSHSTEPPADGWDGDLINAIGAGGVCELFGLRQPERGETWGELAIAKLTEYANGCQAGCELESRGE